MEARTGVSELDTSFIRLIAYTEMFEVLGGLTGIVSKDVRQRRIRRMEKGRRNTFGTTSSNVSKVILPAASEAIVMSK